MPEPKAPVFTKLQPALAAARNRLFIGEQTWRTALGGLALDVGHRVAWRGGDVSLTVRGTWGAGPYELAVAAESADVLAALLDLPLAGVAWGDLPPALRRAMWESGLEATIQALRAASGEEISVADIEAGDPRPLPPNPEWIYLDVSAADGSGALSLALRFPEDPEAMRILSSLLAAHRAPAPLPEDWPVEATLELLTEKIDLASLKSGAPGDIIVLMGGEVLAGGAASLRLGKKRIVPVRLENGRATVLEANMSEEANPGDAARKSGNVDGIEVNLTLELDSRMWQVKDLSQVQPGYVFDTNKTLASPVTLRVNGREWGKGEIVDLEGKVGVRLLSIVS